MCVRYMLHPGIDEQVEEETKSDSRRSSIAKKVSIDERGRFFYCRVFVISSSGTNRKHERTIYMHNKYTQTTPHPSNKTKHPFNIKTKHTFHRHIDGVSQSGTFIIELFLIFDRPYFVRISPYPSMFPFCTHFFR